MLRCYTQNNGQLVEVAWGLGEARPALVWIDLLNPTPEEDAQVEAYLALTVPTRAEMAEIELSARLYHEDGAEFMTMTALSSVDAEEPLKTPITFILKRPVLVTVRYADPKSFHHFTIRAQRPNMLSSNSGEEVMLGLMEAIIDRTADALEKVGDEIDTISRGVFRTTGTVAMKSHDLQAAIEQIGRKGDLLLNRCLYGALLGSAVESASRLDWLSRQTPRRWGEDFWPQPYEQLAGVLGQMGHDEDKRRVLIEKERLARRARRRGPRSRTDTARAAPARDGTGRFLA